jgi:16S rRNA (cytosine1402-N4)-methyltransferase
MPVSEHQHETVLLNEAIEALQIKPEGVYVDGTYGRGGHSQMILERLSESGRLLVMDKDPAAIEAARRSLADDPRTYIYSGSFAAISDALQDTGWNRQADGVLLDLGVSSPQLDDAERGFSFRRDGPLDMRMDPEQGMSAAEWLARVKEDELVKILFEYGEERFARRIARAILCLAASVESLNKGGRLVVISFHSLEDRIVKRFMRKQSKGEQFPHDLPVRHVELNAHLKLVGKPVRASEDEVRSNPRARSAIMRVAEKLT